MRRLNDITAFRRYWYRTSLVEALFIGSKKREDVPSDQLVTPPTSGEDSSSTGMCVRPRYRNIIDLYNKEAVLFEVT